MRIPNRFQPQFDVIEDAEFEEIPDDAHLIMVVVTRDEAGRYNANLEPLTTLLNNLNKEPEL